MSRSFHSTIRKYIKENNYKYSNKNTKEENLNKIREEILRKRTTKKKAVTHRKQSDINISAENFNSKAILVKVIDDGEYIHFPASKEDILGVIERLPYNVVAGIDSINLCLGKEYMEERSEDTLRDSFTNRICANEERLIFAPPALGTYYTDTCKIFIYAYVYDREQLKLNVIEVYLRLQMLSTLVHEIAHHEDNIFRTSRGKWLGFNDWKCEDYAEFQQMNWAKDAVIPYLMDTYPDEYNALLDWIEKYGGVRISLEKLAGESRGRKIGDKIKLVFSASAAVEYLFENIIKGMNEHDAMLEFAKDLHYGDHYEECLVSLDTILKANPKYSDALGVKADTYIHEEEYIKAEETAIECLLIDNKNTDALEALCDVKQHGKDWRGLSEISKFGIEAAGNEVYNVRLFAEMHIIAALHLKEYEEANKYIKLLPSNGVQLQRKLAFEALVNACSGDINNAFNIIVKVLNEERVNSPAKAMLKAIYNYCVITQDNNIKKYELSEYEQNYLENSYIIDLINKV
jgi:hypothetical protein